MKLTLLFPILLALIYTTSASDSSRFLASCSDGCIACNRQNYLCERCDEDYVLVSGVCYAPLVYKDMIYVKSDHFLLVDIDQNGTDVAVIVIFAILAFVSYMGSFFLMQKQNWQELVPEEAKEPAKTLDGKEMAKMPTPKGTPKSTRGGEHVVEVLDGEHRGTPTPKSATPGSPAKSIGSQRSKKTIKEEEAEENLASSPAREQEEAYDEEEEEEPYYPTKKEMATRNHRDNEEDEDDDQQVEIDVHDRESDQRTAQETPSPNRSSPNATSKKGSPPRRKGSNHSDNDYEDDHRPQVQSNAKHNQHGGNSGEEDEEGFESARSGHHDEHEEEHEEEEEEEQEDVMDLNDLGIEHK